MKSSWQKMGMDLKSKLPENAIKDLLKGLQEAEASQTQAPKTVVLLRRKGRPTNAERIAKILLGA